MAQNITVVDTNSQNSYVLENCEAKTLGELKAALSAQKVNYADCVFFESTTKVELIADDSVLPQAASPKGLLFMLTIKNKKIASGAMSRAEAVAAIRGNGLADTFKQEHNGKNWTNASTAELVAFVENHTLQSPAPAEETSEEASEETSQAKESDSTNPLVVAMLYMAEKLNCKADVENVLTTGKLPNPGTFTQAEIDKMLSEAKQYYK